MWARVSGCKCGCECAAVSVQLRVWSGRDESGRGGMRSHVNNVFFRKVEGKKKFINSKLNQESAKEIPLPLPFEQQLILVVPTSPYLLSACLGPRCCY